MSSSIAAVIFDMDGVLVDSEPFICEAAIRMFAEKGVTVAEADFVPFVGMGENRYLGGVAEKHGVRLDLDRDKARTYALYNTIIQGRLQALPGVFSFITQCRKRGLRLALATSADRCKADANLEAIALSPETFLAMVTGCDVEHKKPAPDIFLLAAWRLGVAPKQCLVVEDAPSGVAAAQAAGMRCLGLTTSFPEALLGGPDWVAPDLSQTPPEALAW